jgi:hypothetical protein
MDLANPGGKAGELSVDGTIIYNLVLDLPAGRKLPLGKAP